MENLLSDIKQFHIKVSKALSQNSTDNAIKICFEYLEKNIQRWMVYEKLSLIYLMRADWDQALNKAGLLSGSQMGGSRMKRNGVSLNSSKFWPGKHEQ